ncbi:hypothetical protein B566_EDAN014829, partial [Ephemera danica]
MRYLKQQKQRKSIPRKVVNLQQKVYNSFYTKTMYIDRFNDNLYEFWTNLYGDKKVLDRKKPLYSVGDYVLIAIEKYTISKGYDPGWPQLGNPVTCTIEHLLGEEITGSFYTQEIWKIKYNVVRLFKIEKIVAYRGKGKQRDDLVQWQDYPAKFNIWLKLNWM